MLALVFFRYSKKSYSNLARDVDEALGFGVLSIILGLEYVVLEGLGVVLVGEDYYLVMGLVGEVGLLVFGVSLEAFLLSLLVVTMFFDMWTYSNSSSSPP
jgi:uncharacterized Tic20 family protein